MCQRVELGGMWPLWESQLRKDGLLEIAMYAWMWTDKQREIQGREKSQHFVKYNILGSVVCSFNEKKKTTQCIFLTFKMEFACFP